MKRFKLVLYCLTTSSLLLIRVVGLCQTDTKPNQSFKSLVYADTTQKTTQSEGSVTPYTLLGNEVRVFPSSYAQAEIHLSINKTNPQVLLLSSQNYIPNVTYQGAFWSTNGGSLWTGAATLPNNSSGRGDPSTAFDASGNAYISTMTTNPVNFDGDAIGYSIQRSTNNGATWNALTRATADINLDKEMITADDISTSPFVNNLYSAWSINPGPLNASVQFNRSIDQGGTFSAPITLEMGWGQGTNVQTGINGEVYVCWANYTNANYPEQGLGFVTSLNGGQNFPASAIAFTYTGIRNSSGGQAEFGNIRVNSYPSMSVDKSSGSFRGRIYVVYSERENGHTTDRSVIRVRHSDNQGANWSAPITISIANATQSFFPWISVDPVTGFIYVVYYAFDQTSGFSTNTYVATSNNGGASFSNQKVSSVSHTTGPIPGFLGGYEGDYIGITSYGWKAYPSWMDNRTGQWQDYVLKLDNTPVINGSRGFCSSQTYTASNLLPNSNITWTASPTGIVLLSPTTGTSTTASRIAQGNVTLTATINNNPAASVSIGISTIPKIDSIKATPGACNNGIQTWSVTAYPNMNPSSIQWTVDNPSSGIYIYNPNSASTMMDVSGGGGVSVTFKDGCNETSQKNGVTIFNQCPHFAVSPNPAASTISVSSIIPANNNMSSTISKVNIFNEQGTLRFQKVFNDVEKANINISNLSPGIYLVQIVDKANNTESHQLQIIR